MTNSPSPSSPRVVPCKHPRQGAGHPNCPTCRGTGILLFTPATGELEPCHLKQEIDPYHNAGPDVLGWARGDGPKKKGRDRLH